MIRPRDFGIATAVVLSSFSAAIAQTEDMAPGPWERVESVAEASRFLHLATFGPSPSSIASLLGQNFESWFEAQRRMPVTLTLPYIEQRAAAGASISFPRRLHAWRSAAMRGPDQLRQRVAYALSQIFVCSDIGELRGRGREMAEYQDILARNALGSFRELLQEVTLSAAMGTFLDMAKNERPDPANNIRADENYAREVMQLFTLGLDLLNIDGTPVLDQQGERVPTYTQDDIENLARAFTGWTYAGATNFRGARLSTGPMIPFEDFHDLDPKVVLGSAIAGGLRASKTMDRALGILFNHQNVAPFIATALIKQLTTANPSPGYVARVARVFEDNGSGFRGDLFATVRAILTDEAVRRPGAQFGKLREPRLRQIALLRAFGAYARAGEQPTEAEYSNWGNQNIGQVPYQAPSVFNFYLPEHKPAGLFTQLDLTAPVFQITHTNSSVELNDLMFLLAYQRDDYNPSLPPSSTRIQIHPWLAIADEPNALVDLLSILLAPAGIEPSTRAEIARYIDTVPAKPRNSNRPRGHRRVREAIYLIATAPEAAVLR